MHLAMHPKLQQITTSLVITWYVGGRYEREGEEERGEGESIM